MSELGAREALVLDTLSFLGQFDGWAVMKNWETIPRIHGDLDLVVSPPMAPKLMTATWDHLRTRATEGAVLVACQHITDVPRILARLPMDGFADSLFEVDFATWAPIRGFPAVTYERLAPFLERDVLGYPRTTMAANHALQFLFKKVRWHRVEGTDPLPNECWDVLRALLGARTVKLLRRSAEHGSHAAALVASAALLGRAALVPSRLIERARFRAGGVRGFSCPFDPRSGVSARGAGWMDVLEERAVATEHEVWVHGAPSTDVRVAT
jgi:hypothetical protein